MITYDELHRQLDYNLLTGFFRWKVSNSPKIKIGDIAGGKNKDGYIIITINNKKYGAHRLAWLYIYGYFPEKEIDHKDRIECHNWIDNLRETSHSCNMKNTGNQKNNTSGIKGVCWDKLRDQWLVSIGVNNKSKGLGRYKEFDNAVCARLAGEQCLNWEGCDLSSPAYQYVVNNIQRSKHG